MGGYGVALVGHRNERVVNAIKAQIGRILTVHSSFYNKTREEFLENLIKVAPKGLSQVHLNNSGAESVEAAIKICKEVFGQKGNGCNEGLLSWKINGSFISNI